MIRKFIFHSLMLMVFASSLIFGAEKVQVLRDEFGVPHIFASTPAGAAFGSGYAQAEDRLEQMLRNYRKAEGTSAEVFGKEFLQDDFHQRLWRHRAVAEQHYQELNPAVRAIIEGFQAGVKRYMREHPQEVPAWAPKLEPWQVVALGRMIIWGWVTGDAGVELHAAGIKSDPIPYHGSNQWALAPWRTSMHAAITLVDPHVSWYDEHRWYEERLYAGGVAISGAAVVGMPFPLLGHSRYASVAMTTGGPDSSDVFEEEVANGRYKFKNEWRPLGVRHEKIGVKTGDQVEWKDVVIESTHHGPIVAHKNGKAYASATPYADEFRLMEQAWAMMNARNLAEMKSALAMFQLMPQNVMVGTVDGDIYYLRNGRVPIRAQGCDPSRPMPGSTGACEWQGIHPLADLVQLANPPQGYMENCNVAPQWLVKNSPLTPEKFPNRFYLFNAPPDRVDTRGLLALDLLEAARNFTAEQAIAMAVNTQMYKAELWQQRIRKAVGQPDEFASLILDWNRRNDAGSRGALAFYLFKSALGNGANRVEPPASLSDEAIVQALRKAAGQLPPGATYGTLFRVGREGASRTYPVSSGGLRNILFVKHDQEMVGDRGQSCTQIVILTKPPQSYMVIPFGESDHRDSPHFDDQAEKLFSKSKMKSTYFLNPTELKKHVTQTEDLIY